MGPICERDVRARTGAVIVAHARTDLALRCIETLPDLPPENRVVVLNAPELADPVGVEQLRRSASVVSPARMQGYGANLNLGVRSLPAGLDFWLLANDDLEFADGSLCKLVETLAEQPETAVVGPALVDRDGREQPALMSAPMGWQIALYSARILPLGSTWSRLDGVFRRRSREPGAAAGWISGAAMLVRSDAFRRVGGFDEEFFLYFEDTDLCVRLHEAGWRVAWRADAPVLHLAGASTGPADWNLFLQSRRLYLSKRLGRSRLLGLQAWLAVVYVAGFSYHLLASAIRPRTARKRFDLMREAWRWRLVLLGTRIARRASHRRPGKKPSHGAKDGIA